MNTATRTQVATKRRRRVINANHTVSTMSQEGHPQGEAIHDARDHLTRACADYSTATLDESSVSFGTPKDNLNTCDVVHSDEEISPAVRQAVTQLIDEFKNIEAQEHGCESLYTEADEFAIRSVVFIANTADRYDSTYVLADSESKRAVKFLNANLTLPGSRRTGLSDTAANGWRQIARHASLFMAHVKSIPPNHSTMMELARGETKDPGFIAQRVASGELHPRVPFQRVRGWVYPPAADDPETDSSTPAEAETRVVPPAEHNDLTCEIAVRFEMYPPLHVLTELESVISADAERLGARASLKNKDVVQQKILARYEEAAAIIDQISDGHPNDQDWIHSRKAWLAEEFGREFPSWPSPDLYLAALHQRSIDIVTRAAGLACTLTKAINTAVGQDAASTPDHDLNGVPDEGLCAATTVMSVHRLVKMNEEKQAAAGKGIDAEPSLLYVAVRLAGIDPAEIAAKLLYVHARLLGWLRYYRDALPKRSLEQAIDAYEQAEGL
jgi:hypothetical protein